MDPLVNLESLARHFEHNANARAVFGEPVTAAGRTVIPVAWISYGFGGGGGEKQGQAESRPQGRSGRGGGGGGALSALPLGAIEISDSGTRYVDFYWRKKVAAVFLLGLAAGIALGRFARK